MAKVTDGDNPMTEKGGDSLITIDVYDWQGKTSHADPYIQCPDVSDIVYDVPWESDGTDYTRYSVHLKNDKLAAVGDYRCLVQVVDNENQGQPNYMQLISYQICTVTVIQDQPPVAKAGFDSTEAYAGKQVSFSDAGSYDPDGGQIVKFEWDWNNDGVFEDTGANQTHSWDKPGTYTVQFRVTDDEGDMTTLDPPLSVVVKDEGWAQTWGYSNGYGVAVDLNSNIYVTGYFDNTVNFDPQGDDEHTSNGGDDAYLCKYDHNGNFQWAETWGGTGNDQGVGVAVDYTGNVYVTGNFSDTVNFDPQGDVEYTSNGSTDIFVSAFDTNGNYQWALAWGGSLEDQAYDIATDGNALIYVTGDFWSSVDFNPSGGGDVHTLAGYTDLFLTKLFNTGYYYWTKTLGTDTTNDGGYGVATDGYSDAYVCGAIGGSDILYKYKPDGTVIWSKTWGSGSNFCIGRDVAVDGFGTSYVTGMWEGNNVNFDPDGSDVFTTVGVSDCYLTSFDPNGVYQWTRTWGSTQNDFGFGVGYNNNGIIYVTGIYGGDIDLDPGSGTDLHTYGGSGTDTYLSEFDESGNYVLGRSWDTVHTWNVAAGWQQDKSAYVTGSFGGTVDFDPGSGVDNHTSLGGDSFLAEASVGWILSVTDAHRFSRD